jgi:hypothetical protein
MNKASLRLVGIGTGFLVLFLATNQFVESYQKGETKWYSLVMMSGMSLLLYHTLFKVKSKPPAKKK